MVRGEGNWQCASPRRVVIVQALRQLEELWPLNMTPDSEDYKQWAAATRKVIVYQQQQESLIGMLYPSMAGTCLCGTLCSMAP